MRFGVHRFVSGFGLFLGLLAFAASLTPSMVAREAIVQGALGGALFAIGYGVGVGLVRLWIWLELPQFGGVTAITLRIIGALVGLGAAAYAISMDAEWQNSIRDLVGLEPVTDTHVRLMLMLAAATAFVLFLVAYLFGLIFRIVRRRLARYVPERVAIIVGLVLAFAIFGGLLNGVLVRYALQVLDQSYATLDAFIQPELSPPTEPWRTGSAQSLVAWQDLGRDGRRFIAQAPTAADIEAFWGAPAQDPLRIYAGLNAADSAEARAELVLQEMLRVDAFDREVLVVAVPTGTGFMEEGAIAPLEFLHRGDVATVAIQYSYMQSPFSLIFEPDYGKEAARALMRTVYEHWKGLDPDERPQLYLQGLSLGALNSERSLRLHEVLGDPIDGAVWSGPPFLAEMRRAATDERQPGSPAWRPVYDDGAFIRFTLNGEKLGDGAPWGPTRIVYIQHASDPIVFFDFATLWRRPAWLDNPRGPDVSPLITWYPVVTALQVAADMALSNNMPLGHGHQYDAQSYIDAWVEVSTPAVTAGDIERLKAVFADGRTFHLP